MEHSHAPAHSADSDRAQDHAAMLDAALSRPGVREVMEVYGSGMEKEQAVNALRSATTGIKPTVATTSSHL